MSVLRHGAVRRRAAQAGQDRWLLGCLVLATVIAAVDIVSGARIVLTGLLVAGPLLACARIGPGRTAFVAGYTTALALGLGFLNTGYGEPDSIIRTLVVLVGGAFAVFIAWQRTVRERALSRVALVAQEAVLGRVPPEIGGVHVATRYRCATDEALIGGDLYCVANSAHGVRVLLGDVRGKGLTATLTAAAAIGAFRDAAYTEPDLPCVVRRLDADLSEHLGPEDFVTAVLAEFTPGEVRLANCGHHPPALLGRRLELISPGEPSLPLGLGPAPVPQTVRLAPGDRMLFYTDGLAEARDPAGRMFPLEDDLRALLDLPSLESVLDDLLKRLDAHTRATTEDDVALVLCEPAPPGAGSQR
ncbi:PP2C family protein-serine/threonine phosphatase [Streptomyces meridianus]|uniref:Serine/threonine-protein phosphatase n=1 Tax=Streptomyces meridianus TaxID=2938945 RepID=A0ABT0XE98_9ACTN|nr:PP2C family protein-serine/threonine phosphatase [Streptomyces meridianus]MCM2580097.1 serine/threonine-protein phosphatase [Streptomyces meridianus]